MRSTSLETGDAIILKRSTECDSVRQVDGLAFVRTSVSGLPDPAPDSYGDLE